MRRGKTNPAAAAAAGLPNQQNKPTSQALEGRLNSLKKKASELSTLCDVDVCMICYKPDNIPGAKNAVIWPEDPSKVRDILQRFEITRSFGKVKQMSGIEDFHGKKPAKPDAGSAAVHDQTTQSRPEEETRFDKLNLLSKEELKAFADYLEQKLRVLRAAISDRLQYQPWPQQGASQTD